MISFLKKWRKENLGNLGKYLLYAIGEILLIIVGILIAVNINERLANKKNDFLRCQYLEELSFAIGHDIADVNENIGYYSERNPKLKAILNAANEGKFMELDSVMDKINTIKRYVYFIQQSKSKIEELKYSNIDLISNRSLKNKVLFY